MSRTAWSCVAAATRGVTMQMSSSGLDAPRPRWSSATTTRPRAARYRAMLYPFVPAAPPGRSSSWVQTATGEAEGPRSAANRDRVRPAAHNPSAEHVLASDRHGGRDVRGDGREDRLFARRVPGVAVRGRRGVPRFRHRSAGVRRRGFRRTDVPRRRASSAMLSRGGGSRSTRGCSRCRPCAAAAGRSRRP